MSEETKPESAAAIRGLAVQEAAKMVDHILREGGGTYGDAIRALSPAPQVTEEWVWNVATGSKFYRDDSVDLYAAVRATLAALGIEVRK